MFVIILDVLCPYVLFLREVNLDQDIVLTGADELKIFKSLRVYLCLVELRSNLCTKFTIW